MRMEMDGFLELLADRVAELVIERMGHSGGITYTTARSGPHLPGKSRDWMRRHLKTIPGSRKVGRDWMISKEDYDAWTVAQDRSRQRPASRPKIVMDDVDWADACLADNGIRVPKRSR